MSEGAKRENNELGFIEIDSIFSPVLAVSLNIESARVGKMTNWDKLLVHIKTDGTLSPMEAFNQSAQILVEQFSAILPGAQVVEPVAAEEEELVAADIVSEDEVVDEEVLVEEKTKKTKKTTKK